MALSSEAGRGFAGRQKKERYYLSVATIPLLPTLLYSLSLSLLSTSAIAAPLASVSTLDVGRRLVNSSTLGLPLENVSSRDTNHRSIQVDK